MQTPAEHVVLKVVRTSGDKLEGHLLIKEKTTITWKFKEEFYIQFDPKNNPCEESRHTDKHVYPSKLVTGLYEVTCTVKANKDFSSFPYGIHPGPPPVYLSGNGWCSGCCADTDSTM